MINTSHIGREFPSFSYTIEPGKLREFLLAIGDNNPAYQDQQGIVPPTFATVFVFWGGMGLEGLLKELDVDIWNVLHAEQEYAYIAPVHVGDTVTGRTRIANIYARAGMEFLEIVTEYSNQHQQAVLIDRSLLIVRGEK
jgi:hypothetical protein